MGKTIATAFLVAIAIASLADTPRKDKQRAAAPQNAFDINRGVAEHGFSYEQSGSLLFNGKRFKPSVSGTKDMPRFHIALSPGGRFAAAAGKDIDGQDTLYLLKLNVLTAVPFQRGQYRSVGGVIGTWWSPSGKYLVALCAYEGQRFVRADIKTGELVDGPWLKATDKHVLWAVKGAPQWDGNTDVLKVTVDESCDPYDGDCGPNAVNSGKVIATHTVILDADTLALSVRD